MVIFPLDSAIEIVVPISKFPSRVTGAVIVRADELISVVVSVFIVPLL